MSAILVLGDLNLDIHVQRARTPPPGHEVRDRIDVSAGGSGGTFARQAVSTGAEVLFAGSVGADLVGDLLKRSLEDAGVRTVLRRIEALPSGTVLSLYTDLERSMICSRGANDGLTETWIDDSLFEGIEHVHLSGYMFLSPQQAGAAEQAAARAKSRGLSVSADPPSANLIERFGLADFRVLLPKGCWLFPNLSEGILLSGEEDPSKIVEQLAVNFPIGALTLGEQGALAWDSTGQLRLASDPLKCTNTTGAGDAFAGAFVATYLEKRDLSAATHAGVGAAAHLLQTRSTDRGSPPRT